MTEADGVGGGQGALTTAQLRPAERSLTCRSIDMQIKLEESHKNNAHDPWILF